MEYWSSVGVHVSLLQLPTTTGVENAKVQQWSTKRQIADRDTVQD
jgi:hypothetical protein